MEQPALQARLIGERLERRLAEQWPGLPPVARAAEALSRPLRGPYHAPPQELEAAIATIFARGGAAAVDGWLRALLATLLASGAPTHQACEAPMAIERLRILREVEDARPEALHALTSDRTLKDLALCSGRLLAGGAQLIEPGRGLGRSQVLKARLSQAADFLRLLVSTGGHHGFLELHTSSATLNEFTPDGWDRCYRRAAELMRGDVATRGLFGASWFYDPTVERISPRLAFLRAVPGGAGARFYCLGPDADATRDALATSPTRRALHASGRYTPERWLMVWPRPAVLSWSTAHSLAGAA